MLTRITLLLVAAACLAPPAAQAQILQFNAQLNAANELHHPVSPATGIATLFYDTHGTSSLLDDTYDFALSAFDLTGASNGRAAQAFHIHGAASAAETAGVRIALDDINVFAAFNSGSILLVGGNDVAAPSSIGATSPSATNQGYPSMSFLQMLQSQLAYVNVHTALNPSGEIRGQLIQVTAVPEPETYAMLLAGLGLLGLAGRRRRR